MLKKIRVLFLGLMVLAGSACVTPTHASSAPQVVITYIQTTGPGGPTEELIVLYNNSSLDIDITDWCVKNSSTDDAVFACFTAAPKSAPTSYYLPAYGYTTIASSSYVAEHVQSSDFYGTVYEVTNKSSGSITGKADEISVVDADGIIVSSKGWTSALSTGKAWGRVLLFSNPDTYADTNSASDWRSISFVDAPTSSLDITVDATGGGSSPDSGSDLDSGADSDSDSDPHSSPDSTSNTDGDKNNVIDDNLTNTTPPSLAIIELLPNPKGADAGNEFIEFYNPDPLTSASFTDVRVRLGSDKPVWVDFSNFGELAPQSYLAIYNSDIKFSLTNTSGRVQLFYKELALNDPIVYANAKDDTAWALVGDSWQYLKPATPNAPNLLQGDALATMPVHKPSPAPCAAHQFRNPETGRCKSIATPTTPTPCKAGQVRNPETNRCRSAAATTGPAPCKENQERNPETNRCRAIVKMTHADYGVKGVQVGVAAQPAWYYWGAIAGIVALVAGYALWEWREELRVIGRRIKSFVTK